MRQRLSWVLLFSAVVTITALYYAKKAHATPAVGFVGTTLGVGRLGGVDVTNYFVPPKGSPWLSFQKTQGMSDLYVQSNVWEPGGTTGWHSHPGSSLIIVTEGTVTDYEGHDPSCTPHSYATGTAFVDPGGAHTHMLRNEGTVEAATIAVQLIPAGQSRRIDAPDPGNCHF